MHYLKYITITILLYAAQASSIDLNNNLEKIDKQQIVTYLEKQPLYERQNTSSLSFVALMLAIAGVSYSIEQKTLMLPFVSILSLLYWFSSIDNKIRKSRICETYYNNILKYNYLASAIDKHLDYIEMFLYHNNNVIYDINESSDNIVELFCDWIILYRRHLRSSFFSAIDREENYKDFNIDEIMDIDVSYSNQLNRYGYFEKIKFHFIASNQTIEAKFLVNTLQQSGIHLITNNNHKYVGIINNQDKCYLLFGVELDIPEEENSKSIAISLQEKLFSSDYIDPECYALIIKYNPDNITQTIVPFLCKYFGALTKVDLYEVILTKH